MELADEVVQLAPHASQGSKVFLLEEFLRSVHEASSTQHAATAGDGREQPGTAGDSGGKPPRPVRKGKRHPLLTRYTSNCDAGCNIARLGLD